MRRALRHFGGRPRLTKLAQVLAKFGFHAPLLTTVVPAKGVGAASFTRTGTAIATVVDHEGAIRNCKVGEARFQGMRRVENRLRYTEDLSNAAWVVHAGCVRVGGQADPLGGTTAVKVTTDAVPKGIYQTSAYPGTPRVTESVWLRADSPITVVLSTTNGAGLGQSVVLDTVWRRYATTGNVTVANDGFYVYTSVTPGSFYIWRPQGEIVTGAVNTNPSEYVSVGAAKLNELVQTEALSTAPWSLGNLTVTASATTAPNGSMIASRLVETAVNSIHTVEQTFSKPAAVKQYTYATYLKKSDADRYTAQLLVGNAALTAYAVCAFDLDAVTASTGIVGAFTADAATITSVGDGWYLCSLTVTSDTDTSLNCRIYLGKSAGVFVYLGDITKGMYIAGPQCVQGATPGTYFPVGNVYPYHGACVDGVRYFDYANGNTVTNNVVTEAAGAPLDKSQAGYLPEWQDTNIALYSSDFSGWTAQGTPTRTASAKWCGDIALDLLGDDSAAAFESYYRDITFTGDGDKSISFVLAPNVGAQEVQLYDLTVGPTARLRVKVAWNAGVPTVTYQAGAEERPPQSLVDGCYRFFGKATGVIAANVNRLYVLPGYQSAAADVGSGYFGGVQVSNLAYSSSLVPTAAAAVTRNADALDHSLANIPAAGFSIAAKGASGPNLVTVNRAFASVDEGVGGERVQLLHGSGNNGRVFVSDNAATQADVQVGSFVVNEVARVAGRAFLNDFLSAKDGVLSTPDTAGTMPTPTGFHTGYGAAVNQYGSPMQHLRASAARLTDFELAYLSKRM